MDVSNKAVGFEEHEHPRDERGRFAPKPDGGDEKKEPDSKDRPAAKPQSSVRSKLPRNSDGTLNISSYPKDAKQITQEMFMAQADARDIRSQMRKNLREIVGDDDQIKYRDVKGKVGENIEHIQHNMKQELRRYTSYLASDTTNLCRDYIDHVGGILKDKSLHDLDATTMNLMMIDSMRKLVHQEVESNRQQFTDHGVRHIVGNIKRQDEIMNAMTGGKVTAKERLMAQFVMVNHDIGYTVPLVREGGLRAVETTRHHKDFSEKIVQQERKAWNEGKIFTADEYDKICGVIKTHDTTVLDKSKPFETSTALADNLSLFSEEKLPSMFKRVPNGDRYLVLMGLAAKRNDDAKFNSYREQLYRQIDSAGLNQNLKRDLKASVGEISRVTPKFTLGVLGGEIEKIQGDQQGTVTVDIRHNAYDVFLQKYFDMGQAQVRKLLKDYGHTDFTKEEYDLGGVVKLRLHGLKKGSPIPKYMFDVDEMIKEIVHSLMKSSGDWGEAEHPRDEHGRFAPKPDARNRKPRGSGVTADADHTLGDSDNDKYHQIGKDDDEDDKLYSVFIDNLDAGYLVRHSFDIDGLENAERQWEDEGHSRFDSSGGKYANFVKSPSATEILSLVSQDPHSRVAKASLHALKNVVRGRKDMSLETYQRYTVDEIREVLVPGSDEETDRLVRRMYDATIHGAKAVYGTTQKLLKEAGVKNLTVYRGMERGQEFLPRLSFWTTNKKMAEGFAGEDGYVVEAVVPAKSIAFTTRTSPASKDFFRTHSQLWEKDVGKNADEVLVDFNPSAMKHKVVGKGRDVDWLDYDAVRSTKTFKLQKFVTEDNLEQMMRIDNSRKLSFEELSFVMLYKFRTQDLLADNSASFDGVLTTETSGTEQTNTAAKHILDVVFVKGGRGSGNFGHAGRPGKRGGSSPGKSRGGEASTTDVSSFTSAQMGKHLDSLRPKLAESAQKVYDEWEQDDEGFDPELGSGGICDRISEAMGDVLSFEGYDVVEGGEDGDDHSFIYVHNGRAAYGVDIPPYLYEEGSGYSWRKIEGVKFTGDDIDIWPVDIADVLGEDEGW